MKRLLPSLGLTALLLAASLICAPATHAAPSHDDTNAGYIMVGGPAGSDFTPAEKLWSWDRTAQSYVDRTDSRSSVSSDAPDCPGYWAYFPTPKLVTLPLTSKVGDTHSCTLQRGWNLVGNPFSSNASIDAGSIALWWDPSRLAYISVDRIPLGGSVLIWEYQPATITLTAQ